MITVSLFLEYLGVPEYKVLDVILMTDRSVGSRWPISKLRPRN